ncbi:MAG: adenine deaminase [Thermoanaerobacteraceae bacterium]|nr:adenine deaminase [Thermoanaerobacteraceae bacterium]
MLDYVNSLGDMIDVALGKSEGDLLLKNGRIVNVFDESVEEGDVLIHRGAVVGVGRFEKAKEVVDIKGAYISPAFIDSHLHIESTMCIPPEFAKALIPLGTLTTVVDPHEIANVAGSNGIRFMIESSKGLPMDIFFMLPSCVPADPFETSGADLKAEDLRPFMEDPAVIGLAEMMNYPGLLGGKSEVLKKVSLFHDRIMDGHSPGLTGKELNAYLAAGIMADHECTTPEEAMEKLRKGMWIMIREGSLTRDLLRLLPILNDNTKHRILLCTDDKHPEDLVHEGHINYAVHLLIRNGISLPTAVRLATLNPSMFFGFKHKGGIAPGYDADIIIFNDILKIEKVYREGVLVAEDGKAIFDIKDPDGSLKDTINIAPLHNDSFKVPAKGETIRVIGLHADSIITDEILARPKVVNGYVESDVESDIIKIAVVERHRATGKIGIGFVTGLKLKRGAFATSISHDSHNIIAAGENDGDMILAINELKRIGGGIVVTLDGNVLGSLALPYGGLMADRPVGVTAETLIELHDIVKEKNGVGISDPFMTLSFISLAVCPKLKLSTNGLVDVDRFELVDLFKEE